MANKLILFTLFALMGVMPIAYSSVRTVEIKPKLFDNFTYASFSMRIPDAADSVDYILVLLSGINQDGEKLLEDARWTQFADATNAAILACTFKMEKWQRRHYAAAQFGSGAAMDKAIERIDERMPEFELEDLPLLICGHSAGGMFAYGYSCYNPGRMLGFVAMKGGHYFPQPTRETFRVPGLIISGAEDSDRCRKAIRELFEYHRNYGAPWCWMEDEHGHNHVDLTIVTQYLKGLLSLKLDGPSKMGKIDRSKLVGITVDLETKQIISEEEIWNFENTKVREGWLPSRAVYDIWAEQDIGPKKYSHKARR
jgi:predicted esterase